MTKYDYFYLNGSSWIESAYAQAHQLTHNGTPKRRKCAVHISATRQRKSPLGNIHTRRRSSPSRATREISFLLLQSYGMISRDR